MSINMIKNNRSHNQIIKKIIAKIRSSKSFLITAHMNVEGDALGSELATYLALKKLGKKSGYF